MPVRALRYLHRAAVVQGYRVVHEILATLTARHVHAHPTLTTGICRHAELPCCWAGSILLAHCIAIRPGCKAICAFRGMLVPRRDVRIRSHVHLAQRLRGARCLHRRGSTGSSFRLCRNAAERFGVLFSCHEPTDSRHVPVNDLKDKGDKQRTWDLHQRQTVRISIRCQGLAQPAGGAYIADPSPWLVNLKDCSSQVRTWVLGRLPV
jgi:hypothetical protein